LKSWGNPDRLRVLRESTLEGRDRQALSFCSALHSNAPTPACRRCDAGIRYDTAIGCLNVAHRGPKRLHLRFPDRGMHIGNVSAPKHASLLHSQRESMPYVVTVEVICACVGSCPLPKRSWFA
jgi:hypothetical protein